MWTAKLFSAALGSLNIASNVYDQVKLPRIQSESQTVDGARFGVFSSQEGPLR
jgi:hypothetical protein